MEDGEMQIWRNINHLNETTGEWLCGAERKRVPHKKIQKLAWREEAPAKTENSISNVPSAIRKKQNLNAGSFVKKIVTERTSRLDYRI